MLNYRKVAVQVIADIARRMGHGMAEFIESDVLSVADYDRYCHYVAGLVGIGLSQASTSHESVSSTTKNVCWLYHASVIAVRSMCKNEAGTCKGLQKECCISNAGLSSRNVTELLNSTQLFASTGLEAPELGQDEALSNDMGLFLQKTNIIRDYLEDIEELPAPR